MNKKEQGRKKCSKTLKYCIDKTRFYWYDAITAIECIIYHLATEF